ncbi:hypothetical protein E4U41_002253 [Claviceps citrina]|nr:hypothetical protein E4U41_002253 [Claviceps citrina]
MRAICLGQVNCARLRFARGTSSTRLRSATDKSQQSPFSACLGRLLPDAKSRFSSPAVAGHPVGDHDLLAHPAGRRTTTRDRSSQWEPRRERAPPSELADAPQDQHYSPDDDRRSSEPAVSRGGTDQAPVESARRRGRTTKSKYTQGYTRKRSESGRDAWVQWGYLRYQHSGEELRALRKTFNVWKKRFARIGNQTFPDRPWERDAEWLLKHTTLPAMRSAWHELDEATRREKWPLLMLSAMRMSPQRLHTVLEATMEPQAPGYAVSDVLFFIARNMCLCPPDKASPARERILEAEEKMELLRNIVSTSHHPKGHIPLTQRTLGLFAKALPSEHAHELYTLLRERGIDLHANTLIQFASNLAGSAAHKEIAFEILQGLSEAGADLNEARPSSVITSLLHCKAPEEQGLDAEPGFNAKHALQYFIERGFTLNVIASTAFLDTLCQSGEVEEAIRLAALFTESGIRLDQKAWTTIFRGAKGTLRVDNMAKALEFAEAASVPVVDVLNNALHSAFMLSEVERREERHQVSSGPAIFVPLLRLYVQRFDLEPLQWWLPEALPLVLAQGATGPGQHGGVQSEDAPKRRWDFELTIMPFLDRLFSSTGQDTTRTAGKLQPSLTTIAIMLRAYIRSLQEPYDLMTLYAFFKSRLEEQTRNPCLPPESRLVANQGSLIHDTFILTMTDHPDLSRPALEIFGDMLRDQLRSATANQDDDDDDKDDSGNKKKRRRRRRRRRKKKKNNDDDQDNNEDKDHTASNPSQGQPNDPPAVTPPAPATHPPPTIMTFTILLRGLMNSRHRPLAEHLLQVMREQDVSPNLVTWNTVISGYAHMQDIRRTVDTLQDMEATGLRPDMYTFKAFGRLKDQATALNIMDRMIDANRQQSFDVAGDGVQKRWDELG